MRMLAAQQVHGRDPRAALADDNLAIGRGLVRLLPEDVYDRQPLVSQDGSSCLVADLRLDNREELARRLAIPENVARVSCDASILLRAIEHWGEDCFEHVVGDYAFAFWNGRERKLMLARDFLGTVPLHYHRANEFFAFASMPGGLHAIADIPQEPDEEAIAEFLAILPANIGPQSFYKGIEKVLPGHVAVVTESGMTVRRHWRPTRTRTVLRNADEYADALIDHFERAVRCRVRGSAQVGAHLSSGLDSSAVVALAAPILQESGGRVVAFTAAPRDGFAEQYTGIYRAKFDESPLAAATAAMYPNVEHVVVRSPGREPGDDLDRNVFAYQQPMRNLCSLTWLHAINDAARQRNLKVMLIGQWGNASFSYDGRELLPELLGSGQLIEWARHSATMMRAGGWRLRGVVASSLIPYLPVSLWTWLTSALFGDDRKLGDYAPLSPKYLAKMTAKAREASHDTSYKPGRRAFDHRMQMLCSHDLGNVRKGTLAGWGIDLRDPTADRRLVEFCLSVPTEQYYADGVARALARRAFKGRVPEEVLSRNFRGYQTADWHERLDAARPRLGEELDRVAANTMASRIVDVARLRTILHERPTEDWEEMRTSLKHRYVLLRGISAGHFLRKASGDNR